MKEFGTAGLQPIFRETTVDTSLPGHEVAVGTSPCYTRLLRVHSVLQAYYNQSAYGLWRPLFSVDTLHLDSSPGLLTTVK